MWGCVIILIIFWGSQKAQKKDKVYLFLFLINIYFFFCYSEEKVMCPDVHILKCIKISKAHLIYIMVEKSSLFILTDLINLIFI